MYYKAMNIKLTSPPTPTYMFKVFFKFKFNKSQNEPTTKQFSNYILGLWNSHSRKYGIIFSIKFNKIVK